MNLDPRQIEKYLPETLGFLERLVAVNSFTKNRAGVLENARLVTEQFAALGFQAEQVPAENPEYGNHLFLRRPGTGSKGAILVTHLDTVFPPEEEEKNDFRWRPEGERIYGPGTNDIKGGTAMIWLVLSALRENDPKLFEETHWLIAGNAAEEELVPDFPRFCAERKPDGCRAALVFEACSGQGRGLTLANCRKGSANFRVKVEGRGAHAGSRHHEGANAIVELAGAMLKIAALTDYSRDLTANVGNVSGGGPANRVPHEAFCEVNIRAFDEAILQEAVDAMFALAEEPPKVRAQSDGHPCRLTVELLSRNPAWPTNADTDRLIAIWKDAGEKLGVPLLVESRGGLSDGNFLSRYFPTLDGLGPFGLNGHASERSADGAKMPEFVVPRSFVEMGAVNVAGVIELLR